MTPRQTDFLKRVHPQVRPLFADSAPVLPVLRRTVELIQRGVVNSTTMPRDLVQAIEQDPGLACRLLAIANSPAYSPVMPITSIQRAVIWLGLDTVSSLALSLPLLDHLAAHAYGRPRLMAVLRATLTASAQTHDLGIALRHPDLPRVVLLSLLYRLGEIVLAYHAPELDPDPNPAGAPPVSHHALGVPLHEFSQHLATQWHLPQDLSAIWAHPACPSLADTGTGQWSTAQLTLELVRIPHRLARLADSGAAGPALRERAQLIQYLVQGTGLPVAQVQQVLTSATQRADSLIQVTGLAAPAPEVPAAPALAAFQERMHAASDLNALLEGLLGALQEAFHFHRLGLALSAPADRETVIGRVVRGVPDEPFRPALTGSFKAELACLRNVVAHRRARVIPCLPAQPRPGRASPFLDIWTPYAGAGVPLLIHDRLIGLVYADFGPRTPYIPPAIESALQEFHDVVTRRLHALTQ